MTPTIMKVLLRIAQKKIALGLNSHMAYFTLNASDIPTARSQNELARLLNAPSARSVVFHDDYFAVKPAILASLLSCFGASMPNTGPSSDPNSDSSSKNDDADADDDVDDGDEGVCQTDSSSRAC